MPAFASPMHGLRRLARATAVIALLGPAACVTIKQESVERSTSAGQSPAAESKPKAASSKDALEPLNTPAGRTFTSAIEAEMVPLGSIPYVEGSLPLVSPDARYIATQVGDAPSWPTLLAERGATVPGTSRIDIYELDLRPSMEVSGPREPRLVTSVDRPAILGRACTPDGFLIEVPQADGSRWIGLASWQSGDIRWLVADGHVNAFASLGADGRLAWSRRTVDADHFDLMVRGAGQEWSMQVQGEDDWLMPTWCASGDGLFTMHLAGGELKCAYMVASAKNKAWQSLRQLVVAKDADVEIAMRAVSGQATSVGLPPVSGQPDELAFLHPGWRRMVLWRPTGRGGPIALTERSFAAVIDPSGNALVTTYKELVFQSLANRSDKSMVIRGTVVPRATSGRPLHYVLLGLGAETVDHIGITGMRLLPPGGSPAEAASR